jgi:hypothetical protein
VRQSNVSAEMREAVGRELGRDVSPPIAESDIRKWAIAVYYPVEPPRLFWDREYAEATRHGGIVAPEEFNPFAWLSAIRPGKGPQGNDPDRIEHQLGLGGPGLKFMLNGGSEVDYGVRMRPGDVITSVSRLAGYQERDGRLGQMLFTTTEATWTNHRDELVKRSRAVLIRY